MTARLWDWAAAAYGRPGAEAALLRLQDDDGQSIPLLLWAVWTAATGRAATDEINARAAEVSWTWDGEVTGPLRQVRRRLKDIGAEALREQIKAAELESERLLLMALEALAPEQGGATEPVSALVAAAQAWGRPLSPQDAAALTAKLS